MGEVVNLRIARKRKARQDREAAADQNRITHGLTRAERDLAQKTRKLDATRLDRHRRDTPEDGQS